jgi:hypothetical protein
MDSRTARRQVRVRYHVRASIYIARRAAIEWRLPSNGVEQGMVGNAWQCLYVGDTRSEGKAIQHASKIAASAIVQMQGPTVHITESINRLLGNVSD